MVKAVVVLVVLVVVLKIALQIPLCRENGSLYN